MTRLALVALLALASAVTVGFVSRAPASVRDPGPSFYELESGASQASFTDAQVKRHAAYRGPLYLALLLATIVQVGLLLSLLGSPMEKVVALADRVPGGWVMTAAVVAGAVVAIGWVVALPLSYVRGHAIQHAWGLSTQAGLAWFIDQLKGAGVSIVLAGVAAAVFFAIVRWQPSSWWLWMAGAFSLLTVMLVLIYPVVIAPLFNRFTPLQDDRLEQRIMELGERAGVSIDEVLVADASRRSTTENAYVAGLGPTKQVVLYDTLLEGAETDQVMFIVAHELAHRVQRHVLKNLLISIAGLFAGFWVLWWLAARGPLLRWAQADSLADPRVIPLLLLFAVVVGLVTMPLQTGLSRSFEEAADRTALDLIEDPAPAARAFRRLAIANIADLRPPRALVWLLYTHPPTVGRIETAEARVPSKP